VSASQEISSPDIAIIGGGIAGLGLALNLHKRGIPSRVYEAAPELRELGVGITLLPHAMRELAALGLDAEMAEQAVEMRESGFFNRFGQLLYTEKRGAAAGYPYPELGILRGKLHMILYRAARARLGADGILTGHQCTGVEQTGRGVRVFFRGCDPIECAIAIGCDGVNSALRRQFYPGEQMAFGGINSWRGVTRMKPILTGHSYMRIGSIQGGKMVLYPITDLGGGQQLINWVVNIQSDRPEKNDWNKPGRVEDFIGYFKDWRFDWLDVPQMIERAELLLEYPMVDKDPVDAWSFGGVTLAGDAAHPMYPRGSNGAAQALIDARVLAEQIAEKGAAQAALKAYEDLRRPATSRIVLANRANPPDVINIKVAELTGDRPFDDLGRFITQDELRALSEDYKRIAGFARADVR
jgi:2-polyprenyl-6-methoxyphenol hydroxylase-like FAD-dependent oxidoreductase